MEGPSGVWGFASALAPPSKSLVSINNVRSIHLYSERADWDFLFHSVGNVCLVFLFSVVLNGRIMHLGFLPGQQTVP